jgi:hypothetical protein
MFSGSCRARCAPSSTNASASCADSGFIDFLTEKAGDGRPLDPVARFHLGNGARLERINWLGDASPKGLKASHDLMVNLKTAN